MFLFAALLTSPASAEVRLINGSGEPLVFDLLHAQKQERDIALPAGRALSQVYGAPLEPYTDQMLVVRNTEGRELLRTSVKTDFVYAISYYGDNLTVKQLGTYKGRSSGGSDLQLINGTGTSLHYKVEKPDFSIREGKSYGPTTPANVEMETLGSVGKEGQVLKTHLSVVGVDPKPYDLAVGALYYVTKVENELKVEQVHHATIQPVLPPVAPIPEGPRSSSGSSDSKAVADCKFDCNKQCSGSGNGSKCLQTCRSACSKL